MNIDDVVHAFGGTAEMAKVFGVVPSCVSHWRRRGVPPARHYQLYKMMSARGVEIPDTFFMQQKGK